MPRNLAHLPGGGLNTYLVEFANVGLFASGLVVVGSLGYMAWLNEWAPRRWWRAHRIWIWRADNG